MFIEAGFLAEDIRIWYQPCNWWFKNGEDYWHSMKILIPEEGRDEAIQAEIMRLYDEDRTQMLVFEHCFILVNKP